MKVSDSKSLIKIGIITDPLGLKGEFKVFVYSGDGPWISKLKSVELRAPNGKSNTHEVTTAKWNHDRLILKVKGIETRDQTERLKAVEVWALEELFESKKGETIYLREILGFDLVVGGQKRGVVQSFLSGQVQDIMVVEITDEGHAPYEALIPLVKDFLEKIDFEKRQVLMNLPEGLLEANRAL